MLGSGLTEARYKLNESKNDRFRFNISIDDNFKKDVLNNAFIILENVIDKWNLKKDYETVSLFLKYKDYKLVSKFMNKTRSQLWKREKTLNIGSYYSAKNIIELVTNN